MPKIVDHDAQRREIIAQAITLFVEQGYSGLGMRELAAALGMSKSALYHYFPGKEALFNAVVESVVQRDTSSLDADANMTFPERWNAFIAHIIAHEDDYVRDFLLLTEYARIREQDESAGVMHTAVEQYAGAIAAFLDVSHAAGQAVYFQLNGVIMQRLFDNRRTDLQTAMHWLFVQLNDSTAEPS